MKNTKSILMKIFLAFVFIGGWALIAIFINWPLGIEYKINLLRSLLIASTFMVGLTSIFLVKMIQHGENFVKKFGMSEKRLKNCQIFLSWSIIAGCLAILAVMLYFISYEISLIVAVWVLCILQLELVILPLIFSGVIIFR